MLRRLKSACSRDSSGDMDRWEDLGLISFRNISSPWNSRMVRRRQARGDGSVKVE